MRIIIVGDVKLGYTLATHLSQENHEVVIIDKNEEALRRAGEALDVLCVKGSGASVQVLREAGVGQADLLIAVTTSDEMNMVCCLMGRKLGAEHTIARIRDPEYASELDMLRKELGLAMVINPEEAAAQEIARILRFPHADNLEVFARGRVEMVGFRLQPEDPILAKPLYKLAGRMPAGVLFCAVERQGQVRIPHGDTVLQEGDIAHILGEPTATNEFFRYLGRTKNKLRSVMIVGGGRITHYLAKLLLSMKKEVKIIEIKEEKAHALNEELEDALVICGDGTDQELLQSEELEAMDAFVSLTDRDEENLMTALFAHELGVRKVITKINHINYADIIRRMGIHSVISPKLITANHILRYVRALQNSQGSPIESLYRILDGKAEALEFVAKAGSGVVGHALRSLSFKRDILLAVAVRGQTIIIPKGDTVIHSGDHVIVIARGQLIQDLDDLLKE